MANEKAHVPVDPIEPTQIAPNALVIPLAPTVWDDLPDGQHAVTPDGTVWQRRGGLWYAYPWWQREDAAQIIAVCADPGEWAYDNGWPRKMVEDACGTLTPIALPDAEATPGDRLAAIEALTWEPPIRDAVSGRVSPARRKVHVRVRDLDRILRFPPDRTAHEHA